MEETYTYPAKIKYKENRYYIEFLDFPNAVTVEEENEEVIYSAQKCLALAILDYEKRNEDLPTPTVSEKSVVYIQVWMPYFRNISKEIYIKKNLTIPQRLDNDAKKYKVGYSAALVRELKKSLGVEH